MEYKSILKSIDTGKGYKMGLRLVKKMKILKNLNQNKDRKEMI